MQSPKPHAAARRSRSARPKGRGARPGLQGEATRGDLDQMLMRAAYLRALNARKR